MRGLFYAATFFGVYAFGQLYGGAIEGRFFPVTEETVITQTEQVSETRTRIWGSFRKLRQCDFDQLQFRLGTPTASARVDLAFEEGSKQRDNGYEDFGPWVVQLDPEQLEERSYSVVYHRCHPLWLTVTRFYPQ